VKAAFISLFALLIAASAPTSLDLIRLGTADVSAAIKSPLSAEIDDGSTFMHVKGEHLYVAPATAALIKSREEARALVALALAYQPADARTETRKPGAAEYAIALPLYLAAQGYLDRRRYAEGHSYPLSWNDPVGADTDRVRADKTAVRQERSNLAVHLLQKAGGCSGPMVDLLTRMRAADHGSGTASPSTNAGFAKVVLTDLGRNVYPPDRSCE
jgi:hypothetical protein